MEGGAGEERLDGRLHDRPRIRGVPRRAGSAGRDDADGSGAGVSTELDAAEKSRPDYAQYVVCAVMVAVGAFLLYDALTMPGGYAEVDPVGPRFFPMLIGSGLLVMAVILAIAIPRGFKGE